MTTTKWLPGIHRGVSMRDYLALPALSASALGWLKRSPMFYRWALGNRPADTDATFLGTAVHAAVLEPQAFASRYALEPDWQELDLSLNAKPRATKVYKEWVQAQETAGRQVLRADAAQSVEGMAAAVRSHVQARRLLDRCPEREVTLLWERDGRACKARADGLGDGVICELKTTRSLRDFSPWVLTRMGYWRSAGFYVNGCLRLGRDTRHFFFIAVENEPPFDVGVFELDPAAIRAGEIECEQLLDVLRECEQQGHWPGMFPGVQTATISDQLAASMVGLMDDGVEIEQEIA